ncbi:hypothetical protein C1645_813442 [Glomus cerebriforme]|uniref:F-box domain-containing protein n=1 Tax=Glomus cerebriforme TaxID=658196 RepID=A0A397TKJ8_9GLOM|nr:hypothetical protein C1645_813442 [Glomus cerebriforme]
MTKEIYYNDENIIDISHLSPELLSEIFESLQIPELFSCVLVNKKWSANAARILWRNPIEFLNLNLITSKLPKDKSYLNIISTMMKGLSFKAKIKLRTHGINLNELKDESQPMFDYCSFVKEITFDMILNATNILFNSLVEKSIIKDQTCHYIVFQEICNLLVNKTSFNIRQYNTTKIIKPKFILNAYNPKQIGGSCNKKGTTFPLPSQLPQMTQSLSLLEKFNFNTCIQPRFIQELDDICKNILNIGIYCGCCDEYYLAELIKNQMNLQVVYVMSLNNFRLLKISEAIKDKLEQLLSLTISTGQIPLSIFCNKKCDKLIELSMHNFCEQLASFDEWNNFFHYNTSFKNLERLEIQCNIRNFKHIGSLLCKLSSLRKLELAWSEDDQTCVDELFQNIAKYCSNLIQLEFSTPKFTQSLEIILQSCKKLEYFNLLNNNRLNDLNENFSSIARYFPISLKKFGVQFYLNVSKEKVEEFLDYCFMNGIRNLSLAFYIKEFSFNYEIIMKKHVKLGTLNNEFFKLWLEQQKELMLYILKSDYEIYGEI